MTTNMKRIVDKLSGGADQGDPVSPIGQPVLKLSSRDAASIELGRIAIDHAGQLLGSKPLTWESEAGTKNNPATKWQPEGATLEEKAHADYGRYLLSGQFAKDWTDDPSPLPRYFMDFSTKSSNPATLWDEMSQRAGIVLMELSVNFSPELLDAYGVPSHAVNEVLKARLEKGQKFLDRVNLFSQKMGCGVAVRWEPFGATDGAKRTIRGMCVSYGRFYELR